MNPACGGIVRECKLSTARMKPAMPAALMVWPMLAFTEPMRGMVMALLFALWIFNIVLLLGAEVDAEIERARQLQAGIEAESMIQLPPRGIKKVEKRAEQRDLLERQARLLRMQRDPADGSPLTPDDDSDPRPS